MRNQPEPIVDVGIPACGRPRYLIEAIESVLAQTLESWRLWISDDGPGGGPVEAAVTPYLSDDRIRYLSTGARLGPARNSTNLIRCGDAPYVHLLHDDDLLEAGFLERHIRFLEDNPECGMVFSSFAEIDGEGNEIAKPKLPIRAGTYQIDDFVPLMLHHNLMSTDNVVVRRSAYEAVGDAFDPSFPAIYDYEMWLRLAAHFPAGYLAVWDTYWRRHGEQVSYASYRGEEYHRLLDHVDALLARTRPELRLSPRLHRRKQASALLSASLDALDQDDPRRARTHLAGAIRRSPAAVADPRTVCAVLGVALGGPGRWIAMRCRAFVHRKGIRLVYHPYPSDSAHLLL
jgi:glycosyltransferase involved in cell wall biosynthesis